MTTTPKRGWMPIETAPGDGRLLLVAWETGYAFYPIASARWTPKDGWGECVSQLNFEKISVPTHWMPLPEPPEESE